ncbi:hypothetical protein [Paenochrobactrum pullorum]|uniref:hypothetical protein n=1 Tax=Paenochrobactrum pullorum TaxID=1324351 RepID=UPI0035BC44FB
MPFITDASWQPSTYRAAHRAWLLNSTETDGALMPKQRPSKRKLTADQVKRFAPLRMFLSGVPASALTSNWNIIPDNDNRTETDSDDEDQKTVSEWKPERTHEIVPSIKAIESAIAGIEVRYRNEPSMLSGGRLEAMRAYRKEEAIITGGDFERNQHGQIIRIGNLHFAGADEYGINPTEWVECVGDAGAVMVKRLRVRTGAMMHSKERRDDIKETTDVEALKASNDYFYNFVMSSPKRGKLKPKAAKRPRCDMPNPPLPPTSLSFEEARAWAGLPFVEKDKQAALPAAPKRLADLFIGCKKADCYGGGSQAWSDISTALVGKEQWSAAMAQLSKSDAVSLSAVHAAKTYADIGKAHGHSGSYAEKAGKRLLMAANDNLGTIINKIAA